MIRHHRNRDRPTLAGDGHDHRLESVVEAGFVHEEYDRLLSRQGANHAPGEVFAGFRHVDAGVGDETAQPGLDRVGDSQERKAAGDLVEGAGFRLGDAKTEGGEDFGLRLGDRFGNMLLIWFVQWCNGIGWLTGGSSLGLLFSPQGWGAFARESTFSYTPTEKCKAVSNERGIVRTPARINSRAAFIPSSGLSGHPRRAPLSLLSENRPFAIFSAARAIAFFFALG